MDRREDWSVIIPILGILIVIVAGLAIGVGASEVYIPLLTAYGLAALVIGLLMGVVGFSFRTQTESRARIAFLAFRMGLFWPYYLLKGW